MDSDCSKLLSTSFCFLHLCFCPHSWRRFDRQTTRRLIRRRYLCRSSCRGKPQPWPRPSSWPRRWQPQSCPRWRWMTSFRDAHFLPATFLRRQTYTTDLYVLYLRVKWGKQINLLEKILVKRPWTWITLLLYCFKNVLWNVTVQTYFFSLIFKTTIGVENLNPEYVWIPGDGAYIKIFYRSQDSVLHPLFTPLFLPFVPLYGLIKHRCFISQFSKRIIILQQ